MGTGPRPARPAVSGPELAADPMRRVVSPALVGRSAELAVLVSAVSNAPAVVSLEGEAGVGKTRLVAELAGHPVAARCRVLVGRCHPIREPFPFGPLIEVVRGLGADLGGLRLGPVVGALRELMPEVAALLPPAPERLDDRVAERHRVFRALAEVLTALGPAVLVVEDLHWADEQTVDFLTYLMSDPPGELAVLLTFRGEEVAAPVRALTAKLPAGVARAQVALTPLSMAATGALASAILGVDRVSDEFAGYLWERTSGLPFAVEEVLALVRARGLLVMGHDGGWARRGLSELEVPAAIRDSTLERVDRLSAGAQRVAEAAAVLQAPATLAVLVAVGTGGPDGDPASTGDDLAADEAIGSGLLTEQGDLVGFRHVLAAQAVYERLSGARRQTLHGRAAAVLAKVSPVPIGQVAHHLRRAGRLEEWADAAEQAAKQAIELGNEEEAVRLLADILRHAPLEPVARGRIAIALGRASLETLHTREAADLLAPTLELDLPVPVQGELRFVLGATLNHSGTDLQRQRQLFAESVAALDHRPDLRAWAMLSLGIVTTDAVPVAEDVTWLRRAVRLAGELDDRPFEVFVLGKVAGIMLVVGEPAWRIHAERLLQITERTPRSRRETNAYFSIGLAACYAGDLATGELFLTKARAAPAAQENHRLEIMVRAGLALLAYARGEWTVLGPEVEVLLGELDDHPVLRFDVEVVAGGLALAEGRLDDAARWTRSAIEVARDVPGHGMLPIATALAVRVALDRGEHDAGLSLVRAVVDKASTKGEWATMARALPALVAMLAAADQPAPARDLLHRADQELSGCDAPLGPAGLAHAGGLLAAADRTWERAAEQLMAAAELYRQLSYSYDSALAEEAAAQSMFEAGDVRAEATLRSALDAYHRLGATWDAARTANAARRYGVVLAPRHGGGRRSYGSDLSPREREVAVLAATGRTNREIGRHLFLSPSTVEKHVRAVVRKLGAQSRSGIAPLLAATTDPAATKIGDDREQTWRPTAIDRDSSHRR
jgi:DNA-binding CsgD family transcriptional regulator